MSKQDQSCLSFANFQFNAIGKPPSLLSRITDSSQIDSSETDSLSVSPHEGGDYVDHVGENHESDQTKPSLISRLSSMPSNDNSENSGLDAFVPPKLDFSPQLSFTKHSPPKSLTQDLQTSKPNSSNQVTQLPTPPSSADINNKTSFFLSAPTTSSTVPLPKVSYDTSPMLNPSYEPLSFLLAEEHAIWDEAYKHKYEKKAFDASASANQINQCSTIQQEQVKDTSLPLPTISPTKSMSQLPTKLAAGPRTLRIQVTEPSSTAAEQIPNQDSLDSKLLPAKPDQEAESNSKSTMNRTTALSPREDELKAILKEKAKEKEACRQRELTISQPDSPKTAVEANTMPSEKELGNLNENSDMSISVESSTSEKANNESNSSLDLKAHLPTTSSSSSTTISATTSSATICPSNFTPIYSHPTLSASSKDGTKQQILSPSPVFVPVKRKRSVPESNSEPIPNANQAEASKRQRVDNQSGGTVVSVQEQPTGAVPGGQNSTVRKELQAVASQPKAHPCLPPDPYLAMKSSPQPLYNSQKRKREPSTGGESPIKFENQESLSDTSAKSLVTIPGKKLKKKAKAEPVSNFVQVKVKVEKREEEEIDLGVSPMPPSSSNNRVDGRQAGRRDSEDNTMKSDKIEKGGFMDQQETSTSLDTTFQSKPNENPVDSNMGLNVSSAALSPSIDQNLPVFRLSQPQLLSPHRNESNNERGNSSIIPLSLSRGLSAHLSTAEPNESSNDEIDKNAGMYPGNREPERSLVAYEPPTQTRPQSPRTKAAGPGRRTDTYRRRSRTPPRRTADCYTPQRSRRSISPVSRGRDLYSRRIPSDEETKSVSNGRRYYRPSPEPSRSRDSISQRSWTPRSNSRIRSPDRDSDSYITSVGSRSPRNRERDRYDYSPNERVDNRVDNTTHRAYRDYVGRPYSPPRRVYLEDHRITGRPSDRNIHTDTSNIRAHRSDFQRDDRFQGPSRRWDPAAVYPKSPQPRDDGTLVGGQENTPHAKPAFSGYLSHSEKSGQSSRHYAENNDSPQNSEPRYRRNSQPMYLSSSNTNVGSDFHQERDAGNIWRLWGASVADARPSLHQPMSREGYGYDRSQSEGQTPASRRDIRSSLRNPEPSPTSADQTATISSSLAQAQAKRDGERAQGIHIVRNRHVSPQRDGPQTTIHKVQSTGLLRPFSQDAKQVKEADILRPSLMPSSADLRTLASTSPKEQDILTSKDVAKQNPISVAGLSDSPLGREAHISHDLMSRMTGPNTQPSITSSGSLSTKTEKRMNDDWSISSSSNSLTSLNSLALASPLVLNASTSVAGVLDLQKRITDRDGKTLLSSPAGSVKYTSTNKSKPLIDRFGISEEKPTNQLHDHGSPQGDKGSNERHRRTSSMTSNRDDDRPVLLRRFGLESSLHDQPGPSRGRDRNFVRSSAPSNRKHDLPKKPLQDRFS